MPSLVRTARDLVTAPVRLTVHLVLGLPVVAAELPGLIRDARILVAELAQLSRDAPRGALTDVVEDLARLADDDGELTLLLREAARLTAARADEAPPPVRSATAGRASARSAGSSPPAARADRSGPRRT